MSTLSQRNFLFFSLCFGLPSTIRKCIKPLKMDIFKYVLQSGCILIRCSGVVVWIRKLNISKMHNCPVIILRQQPATKLVTLKSSSTWLLLLSVFLHDFDPPSTSVFSSVIAIYLKENKPYSNPEPALFTQCIICI